MGYFANGTEGELYEERFCNNCVHQNPSCATWEAHMLYNYEECNKPDSILETLIPRSKDGLSNEQCRMFIRKP